MGCCSTSTNDKKHKISCSEVDVDKIISHWFCYDFKESLLDVKSIIISYYPYGSYYLLRRRYYGRDTSPALLLGVFSTYYKTEKAKETYVEITNEKDPFETQGGHIVDLQKDVEIIKNESFNVRRGNKVYAICKFDICMGSTWREILEWCTQETFDRKYKHLTRKKNEGLNCFEYEICIVDKLRFDNDRNPFKFNYDSHHLVKHPEYKHLFI